MAQNTPGSVVERVAFFGGSFDPPHLGHLAVARAAKAALGLDRVLFAPVGAQPLKPGGSSAGFEDRAAMTRLAIAAEPGFELSLADAPQPDGTPNYTWKTLQRMRGELHAGSRLYCLMGADSLAGLRYWYRSAELPFLAPLIVASRPGELLEDLRALLPEGLSLAPAQADIEDLPPCAELCEVQPYLLRNSSGQEAPFWLLPHLAVEISATQIRESLHNNPAQAARLLPSPVIDWIRSQRLYR